MKPVKGRKVSGQLFCMGLKDVVIKFRHLLCCKNETSSVIDLT